MEGISGSLEGYDELLKVLQSLEDEKEVNKLLKKTNRAAIKPIQRGYKGLPFTARLTKGIAIRATKVDGNKNPNAVVVGPTTDVFPIRFLEGGTVERYTKVGAYRGRIVGKHAIEPFLDAAGKKLQKDIPASYGEDLVKLTKRDVKRISKKK
jgi:hypothetical protein